MSHDPTIGIPVLDLEETQTKMLNLAIMQGAETAKKVLRFKHFFDAKYYYVLISLEYATSNGTRLTRQTHQECVRTNPSPTEPEEQRRGGISSPNIVAAQMTVFNRLFLANAKPDNLPIYLRQMEEKEAHRLKVAAADAIKKGNIEVAQHHLEVLSRHQTGPLVEVDWNDVHGEQEWIWEGKIPLETISLLAGIGGLGKSTATLDLAATISTGRPFPDGTVASVGDTILFSAEDSDKVIKARLLRQGADMKRIHKIDGRARGRNVTYFDVSDIELLEQSVAKYPQSRMLIIDPIASYVTGIDVHKNADVRRVMTPLGKFAEKHKLAVVIIMHLNKNDASGADNRISGSMAWRDLARCVWFVVPDKRVAEGRLFLPNKQNGAPLGKGFTFDFDGPTLRWGGETDITLQDAMAVVAKTSKTDNAEEWLRQRLRGGKQEAKRVSEDADRLGISEWSLRQAVKIIANATKDGYQGTWFWSLKVEDDKPF
jgi:putative DNA primase/helicase